MQVHYAYESPLDEIMRVDGKLLSEGEKGMQEQIPMQWQCAAGVKFVEEESTHCARRGDNRTHQMSSMLKVGYPTNKQADGAKQRNVLTKKQKQFNQTTKRQTHKVACY